jgi:hypothetical protein
MEHKNENKIKHLEFIQLTITRMNVNSFMVKGWLVTLVAAIFILAEKEANTKFLWYAPFATLVFYGLDAYFLMIERQFRSLYDHVRILREDQIDYSMDTSNFQSGKNSYLRCIFSLTLLLFYPVVLAASLLAAAYINQ